MSREHRRASPERAWIVYRAGFGFALHTAVATYALLMIDHGLGPLELALLGTSLEIAYTLGEVPTGVVADRHGRRRSVVIGLVVSGAASVVTATAWLPILPVAAAVWGLGWTFLSGADVAWITDEVGEERARPLYASGQRAELLGSVAGIAAGAAVGQVALWVPLVAGGVGLALLGGWLAARMPETAPVRTHEDRPTMVETVRRTRASMRTRKGMGIALLMMVALGLAGEGVDRMWQLQLVEADAAKEAVLVVSLLLALGLLGGAAASGFVSRLVATDDPTTPRRWLTIANAGVTVSVLLLAVGPWWVGAAGLVASMALRTASYPLVTAWVNRYADPSTRATLNSLVGQAESVGEIAGGPLLGGIAAVTTVGTGLGASAAVFAVAALITLTRRAPDPEPASNSRAPARELDAGS